MQIADAPGRGEPGSGAIDWPAVLGQIAQTGYTGALGIECQPTGPSVQAFAMIRELAARA